MSEGRVAVIIVTYNSQGDLAECLEALLADDRSPVQEIWVADNASTDDTLTIAHAYARQHHQVRVQANPANLGYAGGVNSAWPHTTAEFVAVLNPDCVVERGWLVPLLAWLDAQPRTAAVNPLLLLHADDGDRVNAAGQVVHISGLGFNRGLWQPRHRVPLTPAIISGLQGGAFVIRRAVLAAMGGWDDSGFLYHEDVELSWLLHLMGYDMYCVPASVVWHKYHLTMDPNKLFLLERNRWLMLLTYVRPPYLLWIAPWLALTEAMMWAYCLLRGWHFVQARAQVYAWLWGHRASLPARAARIQALRQRSDATVFSRLAWNYVWSQFLSLGRERGPSARQRVQEVR